MQYIYSEYILSHSLLAMKYIFSLVILLDYNILVIYTSGQYIHDTMLCVCNGENLQSDGNILSGGCQLSGGRVDTCPRNPGNRQLLWVQMKHVVEAGNYPVIRPLNH